MDIVHDEMGKLDAEGFDVSLTGFDWDATADVEVTEDEFTDIDTEVDAPPTVQRGELWQLGRHYLMCGDATSNVDIEKLLNGVQPKMVFTDPPYGVSIGSKNNEINKLNGTHSIGKDIIGDTLSTKDLHDMLVAAMKNLREHCAEDCSYYVTAPQGGDLGLMMMMMKDAGLQVKHNLIWVKNAATFSMGRLDYNYRHEPIFYTWGEKHHFYGDYDTTVIDDTYISEKPIDDMTRSELKAELVALRDKEQDSVIYCDKPQHCDLHPTMKPIGLIARFLKNSSLPEDPVIDIFGGSGSTLMACEQLNRNCYMMEIDPHYCDVIIDRWEKYTGDKAAKV